MSAVPTSSALCRRGLYLSALFGSQCAACCQSDSEMYRMFDEQLEIQRLDRVSGSRPLTIVAVARLYIVPPVFGFVRRGIMASDYLIPLLYFITQSAELF